MNDDKRTWRLVAILAGALVSLACFFVVREFDAVNARIDRVVEFLLEKFPNTKGPG